MTVNIIKKSDFLFVGGINHFVIERNNNPIVTMKTINGKYNPYPNIVVDRKLYSWITTSPVPVQKGNQT